LPELQPPPHDLLLPRVSANPVCAAGAKGKRLPLPSHSSEHIRRNAGQSLWLGHGKRVGKGASRLAARDYLSNTNDSDGHVVLPVFGFCDRSRRIRPSGQPMWNDELSSSGGHRSMCGPLLMHGQNVRLFEICPWLFRNGYPAAMRVSSIRYSRPSRIPLRLPSNFHASRYFK
jgi:hypothetical protein